ncbi:protein SRC2 [Tanacetum coccineum]
MDITVVSASGLKNVNLFMRMGVYVEVSLINGDSTTKQKTYVSKGNKNPRWNHRIKFSINESYIQNTTLVFILHSRRLLGDRIIGEVSIPIHELLDNVPGSESDEHIVEYQVRSIRGKSRVLGDPHEGHPIKDSRMVGGGAFLAPSIKESPYEVLNWKKRCSFYSVDVKIPLRRRKYQATFYCFESSCHAPSAPYTLQLVLRYYPHHSASQ